MSKAEYLKNWTPYRYKRYVLYVLATLMAISLPFITIGGNQIFLLSFDHKQLHLIGTVYDMQELYLMPFLVMFLFIFIFFITVLGGRVWCGWACPQTIFRVLYRDFIETKLLGLRKKIENKQKEPDMSLFSNKLKKAAAILIWTVLAVLAASNFIWFFVPPADYFAYLADIGNHTVLLGFLVALTAFLVYDVIWLQEDFCVYICPYSRVQSVLYDNDTIMAIYSEKRGGKIYEGETKVVEKQKQLGEFDECTTCESCVTVCPTHIDIRKGMQLECINCLECVDACTQVMGGLKEPKPSLVDWSSTQETVHGTKTNYFRTKIIGYIAVLIGVVVALLSMGSTKENMLLNINRTTQLYSVKENNVVENYYTFLIHNTDSVDHKYSFEIVSHPEITVKRPSEETFVKAGGNRKIVVSLATDAKLANDTTKDTPLTIHIKAFAADDKENIQVLRDTVFVYPRADLLK